MRLPGSRRLASLTATAVAVSVAVVAVVAVSASAATIGGFGVRPAHPDPNNPATRAYFIVHAKGGSTRTEAVVVTNDGAKPLVLAVDGVDGLTGVTSGVVYANRGVAVHGAGAWVKPAARRVTVPPRSSRDVRFALTLPKAARPGDHVAGIAFEALEPAKAAGSFAVTVVVRTVVGIEVVVPGPATQRLRILGLALAPLPGTAVPSAVVTLEDVGRKLCRPQLTVAITGQAVTTRSTQTLGTILPGDRIAYPFRWPGALGQGHYIVSATSARCGGSAGMRANAAFMPAGTRAASGSSPAPVAPTAPLASSTSGGAWWLYAVGGLIVGIGGLLAAGRLRGLARRRDPAER